MKRLFEKNETVGTAILMLLCTVGSILIGLNAAHLSNGMNVVLFVIGIILVSMSTTIAGLLQTAWKKKK